ncbi:MAG: O-antigen ligase family protein [Planctomycetota bacterium]|nr:O-antigen ligase family protein [Planctomycetota bacterium]
MMHAATTTQSVSNTLRDFAADATTPHDARPLGGHSVPLATVTRWLAVGVGFSIPVSTSFSEIMVGLFILCCLFTDRPNWRWMARAGGGAVALSMGLFGLLTLGIFWSTAGFADGFRCLLKYREFLYLPMMAKLFTDRRWRQPAMWSYLAGCAAILALSYLEWCTTFDMGITREEFPGDHVISKDRIVHSLLMSLFAYFCALEFLRTPGRIRWLFLALIGVAAFNIVFLVQGRTGYVTLSALLTLLFANLFGKRGLIAAGLVLLLGAAVAYGTSQAVRTRFDLTWNQFRNQFGAERKHSDDPRLEFYVTTMTLLRDHPWMGTGTGSFEGEYAELIKGKDLRPVSEPHNEYLLLSVQLGLVGGFAYLTLLGTQWYSGRRMPDWERQVMQGTILCIGIGSLFNSLLLSVTGGLVWSYFAGMACGAWGEADTGVESQLSHSS